MADKTIGDLTQAESIGGEDLFVLQQNGEAKKLKGEQLMDYVTLSVISVTAETLPAGSQATATYNKTTGELYLGIPQGEQGNIGPANTLTIGAVTSGAEASATITGEAPNQVLNLVLKQGDKGNPGDDAPTITGITIRQSDYHMIVTLSDGTSYDAGYCRGASGAGTGDMLASTYDPQGKAQDIFAYIDNAISGVTKSDIGLGNVDNVKQYSASNPPPYPVTSVNGQTGNVTVQSGSEAASYTATLLSSGWAADGSYQKQIVTVTGLKANYPVSPVVDAQLSGTDADGDAAILTAFAAVSILQTAENKLIAYIIGGTRDIPETNIPLIINTWG